MNAVVIDKLSLEVSQEDLSSSGLFQVWIDLNFGELPSDWWWNSPPQTLGAALDEAAEARKAHWICTVLPEGNNPRSDGRWDNP